MKPLVSKQISNEKMSTPLYKHFVDDSKIFEDSFMYGRYYVISEIREDGKIGQKVKMDRVVKRKNHLRIKRNDSICMRNSLELDVGDIVFFDNGGDEITLSDDGETPVIRYHFEYVGSLLKGDKVNATYEEKFNIIKKFPHI
jgi:hypothetical protein